MPEPVHCDEKMELARLIPRFQALPELLVFRCPHDNSAARPNRPKGTIQLALPLPGRGRQKAKQLGLVESERPRAATAGYKPAETRLSLQVSPLRS